MFRLVRPASRGAVVLAVLVAVAAGSFGAAAASLLGWRFAPSLDGVVAAQGLDRTVFPGLTVGDCAGWEATLGLPCAGMPAFIPNPDGEGVRYGIREYTAAPTPATRDYRAFTAGVRDRLAAAGWHLDTAIREHAGVDNGDTSVLDGTGTPETTGEVTGVREATFLASRGDVVLEFFGAAPAARFTIARAAPRWLWPVTVAGALLGAAAGWLLTAWISRRTAGRPAVASRSTRCSCWPPRPPFPVSWRRSPAPGEPGTRFVRRRRAAGTIDS
ncbi:hypothetical protein Ade02nite_30460 [Paractinoplanes deccanensis]|uniref:DUF3592 domain-containing protein n=1 Tax=Paractinoplanes deccanensis TaxID=113561 RepID=A0ABQ3Y365_9ACTN|nr:hypothetical protein [Actinoplanes deccanensis]GID74405.1 hypothetical protein Ade02nite_30460 [Actinoplanes deccanensis]